MTFFDATSRVVLILGMLISVGASAQDKIRARDLGIPFARDAWIAELHYRCCWLERRTQDNN